jgi:hypothetical protein
MRSQNRLKPENCNKAMCKTCMFGPTPISLSPERLDEIHNYLVTFQSSHVCHTTNKTCYGALQLQAQALYSMNMISSPTVEALLEAANKLLGL